MHYVVDVDITSEMIDRANLANDGKAYNSQTILPDGHGKFAGFLLQYALKDVRPDLIFVDGFNNDFISSSNDSLIEGNDFGGVRPITVEVKCKEMKFAFFGKESGNWNGAVYKQSMFQNAMAYVFGRVYFDGYRPIKASINGVTTKEHFVKNAVWRNKGDVDTEGNTGYVFIEDCWNMKYGLMSPIRLVRGITPDIYFEERDEISKTTRRIRARRASNQSGFSGCGCNIGVTKGIKQ